MFSKYSFRRSNSTFLWNYGVWVWGYACMKSYMSLYAQMCAFSKLRNIAFHARNLVHSALSLTLVCASKFYEADINNIYWRIIMGMCLIFLWTAMKDRFLQITEQEKTNVATLQEVAFATSISIIRWEVVIAVSFGVACQRCRIYFTLVLCWSCVVWAILFLHIRRRRAKRSIQYYIGLGLTFW